MSANDQRPDAPLVRFSTSPRQLPEGATSPFIAAAETPFPQQRTILWTPESVRRAEARRYELVISQEVLAGVNDAVGASLAYEIGGFLLGNKYRCPNSGREYLVIDQFSPAAFTESDSVSLMFTAEAWANLSDELEGKFRGKELLGWYHSHPRMEVFLSSTDVQLQTQRFPEPWMTALVIEPQKGLAGFFVWNEGALDVQRTVPFHELLDSVAVQTRTTRMPWVNFSGSDGLTGAAVAPAIRDKQPAVQPQPPPPRPPVGPVQVSRTVRIPNWLLITACALLLTCIGLGAALMFKGAGPSSAPAVISYSLSAPEPLRPAASGSTLMLRLQVQGSDEIPDVFVNDVAATVNPVSGRDGEFRVEVKRWREALQINANAMTNASAMLMKLVQVRLTRKGVVEQSSAFSVAVPIEPLKVTASLLSEQAIPSDVTFSIRKPDGVRQFVPLFADFSQEERRFGAIPLSHGVDGEDGAMEFTVPFPQGLVAKKWVKVEIKDQPAGLVVGATAFRLPETVKITTSPFSPPIEVPNPNAQIDIKDPPSKPRQGRNTSPNNKKTPAVENQRAGANTGTGGAAGGAAASERTQSPPAAQPQQEKQDETPAVPPPAAANLVSNLPASRSGAAAPQPGTQLTSEAELLQEMQKIDKALKDCKPSKENFGPCSQQVVNSLRALDAVRLTQLQPSCEESGPNWYAVLRNGDFDKEWKDDLDNCIDATVKTLKARVNKR